MCVSVTNKEAGIRMDSGFLDEPEEQLDVFVTLHAITRASQVSIWYIWDITSEVGGGFASVQSKKKLWKVSGVVAFHRRIFSFQTFDCRNEPHASEKPYDGKTQLEVPFCFTRNPTEEPTTASPAIFEQLNRHTPNIIQNTIQKVFNKVPDAKAEALRLLEMGIKPPPPERPLPKPRHKCDPKFECGVKTVANRAVLNNINCHSRGRENNITLPQHQGHPNPKMPAGLVNNNLCGKGRGSKRSESKTLEPGTI